MLLDNSYDSYNYTGNVVYNNWAASLLPILQIQHYMALKELGSLKQYEPCVVSDLFTSNDFSHALPSILIHRGEVVVNSFNITCQFSSALDELLLRKDLTDKVTNLAQNLELITKKDETSDSDNVAFLSELLDSFRNLTGTTTPDRKKILDLSVGLAPSPDIYISFDDCFDTIINKPKNIPILLDLDSACNFINDNNIILFIKQLTFLKKKFKADTVTISLSTHKDNFDKIKEISEMISPKLSKNIKIGLSFYYGGIYNYNKKSNIPIDNEFNSNKLDTFNFYYTNCFNNDTVFFAIFDATIDKNIYKRYQNELPMLLGRPSQSNIEENNFMNINTTTQSFNGVIEILNTYINSIKHIHHDNILDIQKDMMTHISSYELKNKVIEKNFNFIFRYFNEGYADKDDYTDILFYIEFFIPNMNISTEELLIIRKILSLISLKSKENKKLIKN